MEKIRTFIAIEIPDEVREKINSLRQELGKDRGGVSRVKTKSIHLTLKFLGHVEADRIEPIGRALERAGEGVNPFTLTVGGVGAFPNINSPRVVWVGVAAGEELKRLYENIEEELEKIGFEKERRAFHPHLTLLRIKSRDEGRRLSERIEEMKEGVEAAFSTDEVILFKSKLSPGGAEYSALKRISLKGA